MTEMLCAAWEYDLLDSELAQNMLRMHAVHPCLSRPFEKTAALFVKFSCFPQNTDELLAHLGGHDPAGTWQYLKRMRRK